MTNTCLHTLEVTGVYAAVITNILPELFITGMRVDVVVINALFGVTTSVAVEMLSGTEIISVSVAGIDLGFVVEVAYAVKMLAGVWAGAIIGVVSGIDAEANACVLAAVIIDLEFASASPLEDPFLCC